MLNISTHQENANQFSVSYHFIPGGMATIKTTEYKKGWQGCREKGNFYTIGEKVNQALSKTENRFPNKLKLDLPYKDQIHPNEMRLSVFSYSLWQKSQDMELTSVLINR